MKGWHYLYGLSALLFAIGSAFAIGTVFMLPFVVVPRGRREKYTVVALERFARGVLWFLRVQPTVQGTFPLPNDKGALIICNHRSWLDPMLLMAHTRASGLSKSQVFWIPFIGFYGWLSGSVFFNRGSPTQRKRAREETMWLLGLGARIFVFPEGTRTRNGQLSEKVSYTLMKDCFEAGIPVVACAVSGTERALPVDRLAARPNQPVWLDLGTVFYPADFADGQAFADAAWNTVVVRVAELERRGAL